MRYDRQIILPEIGEEGQKKLQEAKVLIVGVGGLLPLLLCQFLQKRNDLLPLLFFYYLGKLCF